MDTMQLKEAAQKIVRQNVRMAIGQEPFFGALALRLDWVADEQCPTMATDGKSVIYNPAWVLQISAEELKAVAIHEIMHVALMHPLRIGDRDPMRCNIAMDYAINILLHECNYNLPDGALLDWQYKGLSWEQIYAMLPEQKDVYRGKPKDGSNPKDGPYENGDVLKPSGTKEELSKLEEDIQVNVAQAESHAKMAGKLPGALKDLIASAREPEEDYRHLFAKFMAPIYPRDYTWQRPSRRFMGQDMYLPSVLKDGVGKIVVGMDTSGSVPHNVLENFLGMINHFLAQVRPEETHVLYCDSTVYKHDTYRAGRPMDLSGQKMQSGGTRFSPVFEYAQEKGIKPRCYVYLTDMWCYDFGPDPGVPVIWMQYGNYNNRKVPFGTVVKIKTV